MKTKKEQIEAATMAIAREMCQYYNRGRCDLGSPTCNKTSIQLCPRKEAIVDSLNRIVKQEQIDVLNRVMTYINDKIEAEYGDMSDSVKYLTINIYDFDDFIDELIKEVENDNSKSN